MAGGQGTMMLTRSTVLLVCICVSAASAMTHNSIRPSVANFAMPPVEPSDHPRSLNLRPQTMTLKGGEAKKSPLVDGKVMLKTTGVLFGVFGLVLFPELPTPLLDTLGKSYPDAASLFFAVPSTDLFNKL
eukprot:3269595-Rhodomonas_salina.1